MLINRSEGRRYSRIYLQVNLLQVKTIKTKEKKKKKCSLINPPRILWLFGIFLKCSLLADFFSFQFVFLLDCLLTYAFTSKFKRICLTLTMKMKQQQYLDVVSSSRECHKSKPNQKVSKRKEKR